MLDPALAYVVTDILEDVVDRGTGTAVRRAGFRGAAAGKTGTTSAGRDVWFVGYTPEIVGVIWMGLDQPTTIMGGAQETWTGNRMDFRFAVMGQSVTGDVLIDPKMVHLHVNLPLVLAMLAEKLKPQLESEGKKLLAGPRRS